MSQDREEMLDLCKHIIGYDYAPCGLSKAVSTRIDELIVEWRRRRENAANQGRESGGLRVIFYDLLRAVKQAQANEERNGRSKCYYLRRGLQIPPAEPGGLGHWSLSFRQ